MGPNKKDREKIVRLFIRYIKERGLYSPYFRNRTHNKPYSVIKPATIEEFIKDANTYIFDAVLYIGDKGYMQCFLSYITICFHWASSPEGRKFWENEHERLRRIFGKYRNAGFIEKRLCEFLESEKNRLKIET